ncbi:hypothetical protein VTP01DRAFT_3682 [Rhizomucor pusillus]|uniref:uncharacterized protein n=1 Tax=Rhizomucor pusillus TaxID=4840 RepID=UPI003742E0D7
MKNATRLSWASMPSPDIEANNAPPPELHAPKPIRTSVMEDARGMLTTEPSISSIDPRTWISHPYFEQFTRPASPMVNGQNDRRPLTMGNPGVIGLWSFATVTILLGTFNLFLPHKSNHVIFPTALLFGGIAQYIAGFMDLFYGGTFSGTILVSYGAFWAGSGMLMLPSAASVLEAYETEEDVAQANAIYHFMWSIYTFMLMCISLKIRTGTFILTWCLSFVFITLLLEGIYYITNVSPILRVSGVTAYLAALGAYYSGCAAVMEEQNVKLWVGQYRKWHKRKWWRKQN